jgi:ubiquinone/menaquinone biosynthesis C-methylase UbiE
MNKEYYKKFKEAQSKGLKKESKESINLFIGSFTDYSEKEIWVNKKLKHEFFGYKMRHELYENVVFPVLLNGYKNKNSWSIYWLAKTIQNIYQAKDLHIQIEEKIDIQLL